MKKRGLSTVITSLILILLVLVAIGIVWVVVKNIISGGLEQVSLGMFMIDLEIEKVIVNENTIDVRVKRGVGEGELSGIKFVISDGVDTEVFEEPTTMQELGGDTFTLNYDGLVKEVSIAPILKTESGKEKIGNIIGKFEFSNKEIIKNLGAVAWWRFEGNANDEIGGNHGSLEGGVNCNADGKYGKACEFDGTSGYVNIADSSSLNFSNLDHFTVSTFVSVNSITGEWMGIINKYAAGKYLDFVFRNDSCFRAEYVQNYSSGKIYNQYSCGINLNQWYYLSMTYDGSYFKFYINGTEVNSTPVTGTFEGSESAAITLGSYAGYFNGLIDEPMIFNKALSKEQIKALYKLELS